MIKLASDLRRNMAIKTFAVVIDGDVAGTIELDESQDSPVVPRMIAAFSSDPKIIPAPNGVKFGWTYDGSTFIPPTE
jgi:hypothetical protein